MCFRPDVLKNEMKVFFVKYNDPIYVKLEKLDIMIRLTNHSNIAQVLAELKESVLCALNVLTVCIAHITNICQPLAGRLVTSPATVKSKCKSKSTLSGQVQVLFKKAKSKSKSTLLKSKSKSKSNTKIRTCKHFYPIPVLSLFLSLLLIKRLYHKHT